MSIGVLNEQGIADLNGTCTVRYTLRELELARETNVNISTPLETDHFGL
jgi:hypothetical protein